MHRNFGLTLFLMGGCVARQSEICEILWWNVGAGDNEKPPKSFGLQRFSAF